MPAVSTNQIRISSDTAPTVYAVYPTYVLEADTSPYTLPPDVPTPLFEEGKKEVVQ